MGLEREGAQSGLPAVIYESRNFCRQFNSLPPSLVPPSLRPDHV